MSARRPGERHATTSHHEIIDTDEYEPLLEEWIRAQAERDGCPIKQG